MLDIKWIRENPDAFDQALARRGLPPASAALLDLDTKRRAILTRSQEFQARRNKLSKDIGAAKKRGEDASVIMAQVAADKEAEAAAEAEAADLNAKLEAELALFPNPPAADVPDGRDETANVEIRKVGTPPSFAFKPKEHFEIGEGLGLMDFDTAAKLSGSRFVLLIGALARLERALASFMLDLHTGEFGYTEVNPPALVNDATMFGTGQLPKFADDLFSTSKVNLERLFSEEIQRKAASAKAQEDFDLYRPLIEKLQNANLPENEALEIFGFFTTWMGEKRREEFIRDRLWLIPTAEVPLTNMVAGDIVDEDTLPRRLTAMTWCFRSEAGAAGKDTRGMLRQHQFTKVELVSIAHPDKSNEEHERMTGCAEEVLKRLGLPFRTIVLCTGDMGFGARKTYDIEVWLPGQDRYREISSCSNCGDFQARRMKARFRPKGAKGTEFVHTLNGSGIAVGRALIAVLENYQQADGSVRVPDALKPYMGGLDVIRAKG